MAVLNKGMLKKLSKACGMVLRKAVPIKKDRIVFSSFAGHYSDSPKKISEAIYRKNPRLEMVWLVDEAHRSLLPDYVKAVDIHSYKSVLYRGSAKVLVDNVYADKSAKLEDHSKKAAKTFKMQAFLKAKKGQQLYTTWHGTPLKRMGRHQLGNHLCDFALPDTTMVLENQHTLDILRDMTFEHARMLRMGCPRNDALYSQTEEACREMKKKLQLPEDKKIVLFAPTFRNDGPDIAGKNAERSGLLQLKEMDISRLLGTLSEKFGGEWALVCRFHYFVESMVDWEALRRQYPGQLFNGNQFDDMADYLSCTDVLITDASSSMFDFSLTKRPCFLYFPDMRFYRDSERGFYLSIDSLPFPCAETFDGFIDCLETFDREKYERDVDQMKEALGYINEPHSADKIAALILEENHLNP